MRNQIDVDLIRKAMDELPDWPQPQLIPLTPALYDALAKQYEDGKVPGCVRWEEIPAG